MASTAVESELSVVDIVAGMAVGAAPAKFHLGMQRLPVAGIAANGAVSAVQHKRCLRVVVEAPLGPVDRRMASRAIVRETITVRVVVRVAGAAFFRGVAKYLGLVTGRTFRVRMLAE